MNFTLRPALALCGMFSVVLAFSLISSTGTRLLGDDPAAEEPAVESPRRMLPYYYGCLALSDEQRERVYSIQADYADQIDALLVQIEELRAERDAKMEEVLTPGQKLRLQELREEARRSSSTRSRNPNPAPPREGGAPSDRDQ